MSEQKDTYIVDIRVLPQEYKKGKSTKEIIEEYEKDFNIKILPIDTSPSNMQGGAMAIMFQKV